MVRTCRQPGEFDAFRQSGTGIAARTGGRLACRRLAQVVITERPGYEHRVQGDARGAGEAPAICLDTAGVDPRRSALELGLLRGSVVTDVAPEDAVGQLWRAVVPAQDAATFKSGRVAADGAIHQGRMAVAPVAHRTACVARNVVEEQAVDQLRVAGVSVVEGSPGGHGRVAGKNTME